MALEEWNWLTKSSCTNFKNNEVFEFLKYFPDHEILLKKWEFYGITVDSLKWFGSYFSNWNQCILITITENTELESVKQVFPLSLSLELTDTYWL